MQVQQPMHVQYVGAAPGPGCCAVPPEASCAVTGARVCSIISIIIHVGALLAGGGWLFFGFYQWIASITAFVMCGILLCVYGRCAYIAAGVVYLIAATFDALMCAFWIHLYNKYRDAFDSDDDYYNYDNDSDDYEAWGNVLLWFALPPLLGGITLALGAVFAFTAICFWEDAPAPIVSMAPVAQVVGPGPAAQATHHHHQQPQKAYKPERPRRAAPPAYQDFA